MNSTFVLSWEDFDLSVDDICSRVRVSAMFDEHVFVVYGPPRGGMALALALSHRLGIPLVSQPCDKMVWVDDIYESGDTYQNDCLPYNHVIPCVWVDKSDDNLPHQIISHAMVRPETWVVFPWESQDPQDIQNDQVEYYGPSYDPQPNPTRPDVLTPIEAVPGEFIENGMTASFENETPPPGEGVKNTTFKVKIKSPLDPSIRDALDEARRRIGKTAYENAIYESLGYDLLRTMNQRGYGHISMPDYLAPPVNHYLEPDPPPQFDVNAVYPSIQGEGALAGTPMVIVRLQGCDVGCPWCDTKETWASRDSETVVSSLDEVNTPEPSPLWTSQTGEEIAAYAKEIGRHVEWVMLTGGEPAKHANLWALTSALHKAGFKVMIETSGTETGHIGAGFDWVCVSPKMNMPGGKIVRSIALNVAHEIKQVIATENDLFRFEGLLSTCDLKENVIISLQPVSQSKKATAICLKACQSKGWRLSLQMHKYIEVP